MMKIKFCYICKKHIESHVLPDGRTTFEACGHDDRKVAMMQRNLGRKQR